MLLKTLRHILMVNKGFSVMTMSMSLSFSLSLARSQCIEGVLGGTDYNQSKVNQWTAGIVEHSLTHLVKQGRPFKYIGEPTGLREQ